MFRWFEKRLSPFPEVAPAPLPNQLLAFLWQCTHGARGLIGAMALLTAMIGAIEALLFLVLGQLVDWLAKTPAHLLWQTEGTRLLLLALVLCASIGLVTLQTLFKHQALAVNLPMRLRWNFHRRLLEQSMQFYQDEFSARITAKLMQSALASRDVIMLVWDILIFVGIFFVSMGAIIGQLDLWLLLPFLFWLTAFGAALYFFIPRLSRVGKAQADARALMTGRISDAYTNILTIKLFSHTQREANYARAAMHDFLGPGYRQMRLVSAFQVVDYLLVISLILGTCGIALWLWSQDRVGLGAVATSVALALRLNGLSHWIMWEMSSLFENIGTIQDGINTLARPQAIQDKANASALVVSHGELTFEGVHFAYGAAPTSAQATIANFNLTVRAGEKIGLIGRSGAGKSTLVNLLLRFYDLQQGRILIDGQDISQVTQDSLRAQIGMVTQDTSLLHRSVRDNISYGRPDASFAEVLHASERAQAHEFILQLNDASGRSGYDAHVGERGVKLSGGQRQRIAIARVMLKNAPILLLDEATSALDSEVEVAIQNHLYQLMSGKTVIAIAHRLSTIAALDRLIVVDAGQIVESGTHQTLLAQQGLYARLWAHQSGGFLGTE